MDPSTSREVAAHFPSLTAQLPRLMEPSWRHAAAWHAGPRLHQRHRAANVTPLRRRCIRTASGPHPLRPYIASPRLTNSHNWTSHRSDRSPNSTACAPASLTPSSPAAFAAAAGGGVTRTLSIRMTMRRDRARNGFAGTRAQFELVDLMDGRNLLRARTMCGRSERRVTPIDSLGCYANPCITPA